jgi:hypothetical protein
MPPPGGNRTSLANYSYYWGNLPAKNEWGGQGAVQQFAPVFNPAGGIFSPGYPLVPTDERHVRTWDFPVLWNTIYTPRSYEPVSFNELRALADGYDILRLAIETRKDQIEKLNWSIRSRDEENQKPGAEDRAAVVTEFWRSPDGRQDFAGWLRESLEDLLVIDAPAFEIRKNRGGQVIGLDVIDGSTLKVLIDDTGRWPVPPAPAYEQVIHGKPWRLLTADEILYAPRNRRPHKAYGFSPVEQIIITVNTGLRRQIMQLQHFTEGNVPAGLLNAPEGWNTEQIRQFQEWFNSILAGNTAEKTRLIWGPAGSRYQAFKEPPYKDDFDEWLARIVCYALSLPPNAFTRQVNRATAATAQEVALEEGLAPLMGWVKRLADHIIQRHLGHPDLEFSWSDQRPIDQHDQSVILTSYVKNGIYTLNEARDQLGLDPIDGGDETLFETAQGPVMFESVLNPPAGSTLPGAAPEPQKPAPAPASNGPRDTRGVGKAAAGTFRSTRTERGVDAPGRALVDAEARRILSGVGSARRSAYRRRIRAA